MNCLGCWEKQKSSRVVRVMAVVVVVVVEQSRVEWSRAWLNMDGWWFGVAGGSRCGGCGLGDGLARRRSLRILIRRRLGSELVRRGGRGDGRLPPRGVGGKRLVVAAQRPAGPHRPRRRRRCWPRRRQPIYAWAASSSRHAPRSGPPRRSCAPLAQDGPARGPTIQVIIH